MLARRSKAEEGICKVKTLGTEVKGSKVVGHRSEMRSGRRVFQRTEV